MSRLSIVFKGQIQPNKKKNSVNSGDYGPTEKDIMLASKPSLLQGSNYSITIGEGYAFAFSRIDCDL